MNRFYFSNLKQNSKEKYGKIWEISSNKAEKAKTA